MAKSIDKMTKAELLALAKTLAAQDAAEDTKPHFKGLLTEGDDARKYGPMLEYRPYNSDRTRRIGFRNAIGIIAAAKEQGVEDLLQTMMEATDK